MRHLNEAVWSREFVNDLPDSSFLLIQPGGKRDTAGKTTPRSLRKFPVKEAGGDIDPPHVRHALSHIPRSNLTAEQKTRASRKARRLAKEIETAATEALVMKTQQITEAIVFTGPVQSDRETGAVRDVPLLGPVSKNSRRYSKTAMKQAAKLFEGACIYANHRDPDKGRDVRDLMGSVHNSRFDGEKVRGDLSIFEHHREWAMPLIEANRPGVGMSWIGQATWKVSGDGWSDVTGITAVESVDMVAGPATVRNFSEGNNQDEDDEMSEQLQKMIADLQEKLTASEANVIALTEERDTLKTEHEGLTKQVETFEATAMYDKVVKESGLKPEAIAEPLAKAIREMDEADAKAALQAIKETAEKASGTKLPVSDPASGDTPNTQEKTEWDADKVLAEMTH